MNKTAISKVVHKTTMEVVRSENDAARFLEILAESIAKDLKDQPRALIDHLDGMTGTEGAFLCFKLMELLGKMDDDAGMASVLKAVTEAVDHD